LLKINEILKENESLEFKVSSKDTYLFNSETKKLLAKPHISNHYYFYYQVEGKTSHYIDLKEHNLSKGSLIFVCPNQIHSHKKEKNSIYYEIYFKEDKQFFLKSQLPLLLNTLNKNRIEIPLIAQERILMIFKTLLQFQESENEYHKLKTSYFNTLLEEFNHIYFSKDKVITNNSNDRNTLILFKTYLNEHLTDHPSIETISNELGVSSNYLYKLVKKYTDKSPKEYINCLLIVEAKRHLFYSKISLKELTYKLGFSDQSYFSKFFKKHIGKSIKQFVEDLSI